MATEHDAIADVGNRNESAGNRPAAPRTTAVKLFGDIDVGELEDEHSQLMEMQGQLPDEQLIEKARAFSSRVCTLGAALESAASRQHWQGILNYWSIYAYRAARIELQTRLLPYDAASVQPLTDDQYPYAFADESAKDTQEMLGWRRLLDECETALAQNRLLAVVGEPGSGRRLLVQDLLLPILRQGSARRPELNGSKNWKYHLVKFGAEPLEDLLQALAGSEAGLSRAEQSGRSVAEQSAEIRNHPAGLAKLSKTKSDHRILIVFENFESLLNAPVKERDVLVKALASLLDDPQKRYFLALTIHRGHSAALSKCGPLEVSLLNGQVLLAFTTAELRYLINEPAERIGLAFDPGIVDRILINLQGEPTALALLQLTMRRLWRHRERNRITARAYQECGAGASAIRMAMDEVYRDLRLDQQVVFKSMILEMVYLDPTSQFAVSPVSQDDLVRICGPQSTVEKIVDRLHEEDLVYDKIVGGERLLALSSATMLTAWPTLVHWLDAMRDDHHNLLRLKSSAKSWQDQDRDADLLWRGGRLDDAEEQFGSHSDLTTPEREFLAESRRRETRKRIGRYAVRGLLVTSILAAVVGFYSYALAEAERKAANGELELWKTRQEKTEEERKRVAGEQRRHAEKQQQRLANANDRLLDGDLPGALLWLKARTKSPPDDADLESNSKTGIDAEQTSDAKMAQLTRLQLPELKFRLVGSDSQSRFDDMAVSPSGNFLATVRRRTPTASDDQAESVTEYIVEISERANPEKVLQELVRRSDKGDKAPAGVVKFASVDDQTFCIAALDRLECWRVDSRKSEVWQSYRVKTSDEYERSSVVALESNAGLLAVTWRTGDKRSLVLCRLVAGSHAGSMNLESLPNQPTGLNDANVQIASLSVDGNLVAVFGPAADEAVKLRAWLRSGERWIPSALPPWVIVLKESNSDRLNDWGWTASNDAKETKNVWQRLNSFVKAVTFSPSGTEFATACNDGQVLVWSITPQSNEQPAVVYPLMETELRLGSSVFDIVFLNQNIFATGGRDRTARIWNFHTGVEVVPRNYHEATVGKLAFAQPDTLITGTQGIVRTWRSPEYELLSAPNCVQQVAMGAESHRVVIARSPSSRDSETANSFEEENVAVTVVSPNGNWVVTASKPTSEDSLTYSLKLRKVSGSKIESPVSLSVRAPLDSIPIAAFSPGQECRWLVVADSSGNEGAPDVYSWDLNALSDGSGKPMSLSREMGGIADERSHSAKESSTQRAGSDKDVTFNEIAMTNRNGTYVMALVGKQKMHAGTAKGIVYIGTQKSTGTPAWTLSPLEVRKTNDDTNAVSVEDANGREPSNAVVQSTFPHDEEALCVGFSSDGEQLATGDANDKVKIWRTDELLSANGTPTALIAAPTVTFDHSSNVESLAFSPNGDLLATVSSEGEAALWHIAQRDNTEQETTPKPTCTLRHKARILSLSFSPSGDWIITGALDCSARVWDKNGTLVGIFLHEHPVNQVWMPDDKQVLTLSRCSSDEDFQLRRWNTPTVPQENVRHEMWAARKILDGELHTEGMVSEEYKN